MSKGIVGAISTVVENAFDNAFVENLNEKTFSGTDKLPRHLVGAGKATMQSVVSLPYPDGSLPIIVTDPPYYDSIGYSDLSDFFYVWMKPNLESVFPNLFKTELVPKTGEEVVYARHKISLDTFEGLQTAAFCEISRVLTDTGICTMMYGNKHDKAWEIFARALNKAELVITNLFPLFTERKGSMSGAKRLNSSISFVLRKRTATPITYQEALQLFQKNVNQRMLAFGDIAQTITKIDEWQAITALALEYCSLTAGGKEEAIIQEARKFSETFAFPNEPAPEGKPESENKQRELF